jgi:3-deoxy-D-manno-octulosonic-acid transferase
MFGPYMQNFKEIARGVLSHNAAIQCQNKEDIVNSLLALYEKPFYRETLSEKGKAFVSQNQGAIARICDILNYAIMASEQQSLGTD